MTFIHFMKHNSHYFVSINSFFINSIVLFKDHIKSQTAVVCTRKQQTANFLINDTNQCSYQLFIMSAIQHPTSLAMLYAWNSNSVKWETLRKMQGEARGQKLASHKHRLLRCNISATGVRMIALGRGEWEEWVTSCIGCGESALVYPNVAGPIFFPIHHVDTTLVNYFLGILNVCCDLPVDSIKKLDFFCKYYCCISNLYNLLLKTFRDLKQSLRKKWVLHLRFRWHFSNHFQRLKLKQNLQRDTRNFHKHWKLFHSFRK